MAVALTVYFTNTVSSDLANATTLVTASGGSAVGVDTLLGTATGWGEIDSRGQAGAWPALSGIAAPDGHGFLLDVTTLEAQQILAGNWTPTLRLTLHNGLTGNVTADLWVVAYVYNTTSTLYTSIGQMELAAQTVTTTATTFTFAGTALPVTNFGTGDKLYIETWAHVTANANTASTATFRMNEANSSTQGNNTGQVVTPGYVTPGGGTSVSNSSGSDTAQIVANSLAGVGNSVGSNAAQLVSGGTSASNSAGSESAQLVANNLAGAGNSAGTNAARILSQGTSISNSTGTDPAQLVANTLDSISNSGGSVNGTVIVVPVPGSVTSAQSAPASVAATLSISNVVTAKDAKG